MKELLQYSSILLVFSPVFALVRTFNFKNYSVHWSLGCALCASLLLLLPVKNVPVLDLLRGIVGDLSLTSVFLLVIWPVLRLTPRPNLSESKHADRQYLCSVLFVCSIFLYPMTLGLGPYDPYELGFNPLLLLTLLAVLGSYAVYNKYVISTSVILIVLVGYWFRSLDTENLWNYFIDPIVSIFAIFYLLRSFYRRHQS